MRSNLLSIASLALAMGLSFGCEKTPEAEPGDAAPLVRDVPADTATPPADVVTDTGAPVDASDATADAPVPVDATDGATPDVTSDGGNTDASSDVSCVGDGGCWACPPATSAEIINRCTASSCARFDNRARLPRLLPDGGLPPLP